MDERDGPESLKELGNRIDRAQARRDKPGRASQAGGGAADALSFGLRIGLELVVSVVVGAGIGWLLDRWLGTLPWLMMGGFVLGIGAGIVNVYRAMTGKGMAVGYLDVGKGAPPPASNEWDDED